MAHLKTVSATTKNWSELPSDVIVVGVFSKGELSPMAKDVDETLLKNDISVDQKIEGFHGDGSIIKMIKLLRSLLKLNEYDVIHIHSGLTGIIFLIAIFPFNLGLLNKMVFTLHNSWNVLTTRNQILDFIVMLLSYKVCTCGVAIKNSIPKTISFFICNILDSFSFGKYNWYHKICKVLFFYCSSWSFSISVHFSSY